jgi:hypothetical protein
MQFLLPNGNVLITHERKIKMRFFVSLWATVFVLFSFINSLCTVVSEVER